MMNYTQMISNATIKMMNEMTEFCNAITDRERSFWSNMIATSQNMISIFNIQKGARNGTK